MSNRFPQTPPFLELGQAIARARMTLGMDQGALARLVGCRQQTVSRWEAGTSRPRAAQVPELAAALKQDVDRLLNLAQYAAPAPAVVSYAQPFPMDRLDPTTFERFVQYILSLLYKPPAQVMPAGSSGHTQDGLDITVTTADGQVFSFQCKRVSRFGPAEVAKAVAAHVAPADRKHLVLSRVASPQAADALREHEDWELWDKEILSRKIRLDLTPDEQIRLVDIFFRGQRRALLGRDEAGPWLTTEDFFEPFATPGATFSHSWHLKGREQEIQDLLGALQRDEHTPAVLVTGPGGIGKSKILKEALERLAVQQPQRTVRLLSSAAEITRQSLELLGAGPKLLVIDDAHDRDGLGALFEYAAVPRNNTRLLLATRPYAETRIRRESAVFGIGDIPTVRLERLTAEQMKGLISEVLRSLSAPEEWGEQIVRIVGDSPLVAVMAARVIARDGTSFELAKNHSDLRNLILGKFRNVVTGELGTPSDQRLISGILDVLALVQPFHVEDPQLIAMIQAVKGADAVDSARILRLLVDGGIVYRRGHQYRLMPDLLGDYIIETSCLGPNDSLSPFVDRALAELPTSLLNNVFVNLGRMDWRKSGGDPSQSRLLDRVWQTLDDIESPYDPRLEAARSVAIYQPRQALDFVQRQIRRGQSRSLSKILRAIAYNPDYLEAACNLLWELGRNDKDDLGRNTNHPIRVLSELCGFEDGKPFGFTNAVFDFCMGLLDRSDAWTEDHSPLEVLKPILSSEGVTTTSKGRNLVMSGFLVNFELVSPLRDRLINRVLSLLIDPDPHIALEAANFLDSALRAPMGIMGSRVPPEVYEDYQQEFMRTLVALKDIVSSGRLGAITTIGVARAVSWHAHHGPDFTRAAAQAVMDALPHDLDFRTRAAFSDGFGQLFLGEFEAATWQTKLNTWISELTAELRGAYPRGEDLRRHLEGALAEIDEAKSSDNSAHVLMFNLLRDDLGLARAVIADSTTRAKSPTRRFLGAALNEVLALEPDEGRAIARRLLQDADTDLVRHAAWAFMGLRRDPTPEDIELVEAALSSPIASVAHNAIQALFGWRSLDPRRIIDLAKRVNLVALPELLDRFWMMFGGMDTRLFDALRRDDVEHFLKRMVRIPRLEGYWVQEFLIFLSRRFADALADFFFARVEMAATAETFNDVRPANHGPYAHKRLRIQDSPDFAAVLQKTWNWLKQNEGRDYYFRHHAADVFDAMFLSVDGATVDAQMVELFAARLDVASAAELRLIARLLHNAPPNFVFQYRAFVVRFVDRCKNVDPKTLEVALQNLHSSAISGVRSGLVGEPTTRDLEALAGAKEALRHISRLSSAYAFYADLQRSAEQDIAQSKWDGEALDDEHS
jgi:transcriptional regulator with XRE-family HTH domain